MQDNELTRKQIKYTKKQITVTRNAREQTNTKTN